MLGLLGGQVLIQKEPETPTGLEPSVSVPERHPIISWQTGESLAPAPRFSLVLKPERKGLPDLAGMPTARERNSGWDRLKLFSLSKRKGPSCNDKNVGVAFAVTWTPCDGVLHTQQKPRHTGHLRLHW